MAMVLEVGERPARGADDVDVGRVGGQQQNRRGSRGETVEPGSRQRQSGQSVGEIIQKRLENLITVGSAAFGGGSGGAQLFMSLDFLDADVAEHGQAGLVVKLQPDGSGLR